MTMNDKDGQWYAQADETERQIFRDWVTGLLQSNTVVVEFIKTDGTLRTMSATLKPDVVVITESKTGRVKKENPEVCSVWDIDAKGWRSFRFDKVKAITFNISD
jgi:hypothetical protein